MGDMKLGEIDEGTDPKECAKFHNKVCLPHVSPVLSVL